jgi:hypothetical protein
MLLVVRSEGGGSAKPGRREENVFVDIEDEISTEYEPS